ncbi:MAG TPA: hypothetical protein VNU72_10125, partial [Puia sp.]|nr:hypothetical protein [Puia sp.]
RRRKRFLWLLLLLPLGGLGYLTYTGKGGTITSTGGAVTAKATTSTPGATTSGATTTTPGVTTSTPGATTTGPTGGVAVPTGSTTGSNSQTTIPTEKAAAKEKGATVGTDKGEVGADPAIAGLNANTGGSVNSAKGMIGFTAAEGGASAKGGSNGDRSGSGGAGGGSFVDAAVVSGPTANKGASTIGASGSTVAATGGQTIAAASDLDPRYAGLVTQRAAIGGGVALTVKVQGRPGSMATVAGKNNLQKLSQKKQTSFYVGLLASPDLSTVKMQSIKGVGTTFSFLLGYNINRNWAIETGLSLDRKKYYTEGEYFSKEHLNLYPGYSLLNVDGICNMWELPINVRYNFGQGNGRTKWFATAGMSTYLMSKENYSYQTENMATGAVGGFSHTFAHPTQYPFSVINLSMGYEQSLGKIGNLRLEPYLRVPLAGIGTGSLPIMSAGLNIGITRRIW